MSRRQIKTLYHKCVWCAMHNCVETVPESLSCVTSADRAALGPTTPPGVAVAVWTALSYVKCDSDMSSESKLASTVSKYVNVYLTCTVNCSR